MLNFTFFVNSYLRAHLAYVYLAKHIVHLSVVLSFVSESHSFSHKDLMLNFIFYVNSYLSAHLECT